MFRSNNSQSFVTGLFWEPFGVASAIAALLRHGFADRDIYAFGVLDGHSAALHEFLMATGIPCDIAASYGNCFDDGAMLVIVRVDRAITEAGIAIDLLKRHGGVC